MPRIEKLKAFLKNDWIVSLGLFLIFLLTNGYTYAWDDQHLEIPLLKSLIDPQLYPGDYYVDALKANFTSYLFPLLAKCITTDQVPTAYFILYLISRFFLFFYAYKLWKVITRNRLTAALCVMSFILVFRVEEFLYRTFSHQEFALAIIMAAMYYFYKNRYTRAAILFGVAANFHALYSLFPFCYMSLYLLWKIGEDRGKIFLKSAGLFLFFSLPFILWTFKRLFLHQPTEPHLYHDWIQLYYLACPATFPFDIVPLHEMLHHFSIFLKGTQAYWPVLGLWALNFFANPDFRKDPKAHAFIIGGCLFLLLAGIFSYVFPIRMVLDLNLVRNLQFMQFILIGYTTLLLVKKSQSGPFEISVLAVILYSLLRFHGFAGIGHSALLSFYIIATIAVLFYLAYCLTKHPFLRNAIVIIPFFVITINSIYYHKLRLQIEQKGGGFWQLQRNWIDMQNYVRQNTPKNAMILTPNDMEMGGFRIFSERKVLVCYRDCGVIGFNYRAALEWQKRLKDVEHFKVLVDGDIKPALQNAILKYKINYIVFMKYLKPRKTDVLEPLYENETFSLYRVIPNPI